MRIMIVNCHWDNRGDEAAIRAMIDELQLRYPNAEILVQRALGSFKSFPENAHVKVLPPFPQGTRRRKYVEPVSFLTNGRINLTRNAKIFYDALRGSDIVLHAPGGPSIGDLYLAQETKKLARLEAIMRSGVPYAFYAPSMGPFENRQRNPRRRRVLKKAALICLREEISQQMVKAFAPETNPIVTLDSAFQHPIDMQENERKFQEYAQLRDFVGDGDKVIGVTITDLMWHAAYRQDGRTEQNIRAAFEAFIPYVVFRGYRVLFIPQLFDRGNDFDYMQSFAGENCFVMSDKYDCYFQQYVIGRIRAVVGMRYHSNIFSAKMGTPFVSVSYEQKMQGFMTRAGLMEHCLSIHDLSFDALKAKFDHMMEVYPQYKACLCEKKDTFRREAARTTDLVCEIIDSLPQRPERSPRPARRFRPLALLRRLRQGILKATEMQRAFRDDRLAYTQWHYSNPGLHSRNALEAKILRQAHVLEKGMSLSHPREKFGVEKALELLDFVDEFQKAGHSIPESTALCNSIGVLKAYLDFHRERGFVPEEVARRFEAVSGYVPPDAGPFGARLVTRSDLEAAAHGEFPEFFRSRHSVRQFDPRPVDEADFRRAVELAMHAPSACNRQSCRVYFYRDPQVNARLAKRTAGNTGFEADVPNYLVVTSDISAFHEPFERNQLYVDGGIFALALTQALHYYGIGSCILQNGEYTQRNREFRSICENIPENEKIVLFIAIGYYKDTFSYASSHRKQPEEIFRIR